MAANFNRNPRMGGCCDNHQGTRCNNANSRSNMMSKGHAARMMRRLQVLDFALQELTLYLDMYPDCRRAMEKYHTLREEREGVKAALEAAGYPITCAGNMSREHWDWGEGPWPWEYDFAGNCGEFER